MRRAVSIFKRSARQLVRDRLGLALTLLTAPFFVVFYWAVFDDGQQSTTVCLDAPAAVVESVGRLDSLDVDCDDREAVVHASFVEGSEDTAPYGVLRLSGDATDPRFVVAAQQLQIALDRHYAANEGMAPRIDAELQPFEGTADRTPFDLYVPNLLLFALIMLVFSSSMALAREVERGTLERLRLTKMTTFDYVLGMSATQVFAGFCTASLTLGVALAVGFEPAGGLAVAAVVALLTAVSCIALGVVTASFSRTVARSFVVSSFFMFLMVLFSGIVFPVPDAAVFDAIPTVHGARAMEAALIRGAGFAQVQRELLALTVTSGALFVAGMVRFRWLHRSATETS